MSLNESKVMSCADADAVNRTDKSDILPRLQPRKCRRTCCHTVSDRWVHSLPPPAQHLPPARYKHHPQRQHEACISLGLSLQHGMSHGQSHGAGTIAELHPTIKDRLAPSSTFFISPLIAIITSFYLLQISFHHQNLNILISSLVPRRFATQQSTCLAAATSFLLTSCALLPTRLPTPTPFAGLLRLPSQPVTA